MSFQKDFLSKKITDPLAKIVYDLGKQEYAQNFQVHNIDSLNVQVLSIKAKTKTLSKDKFHISVKSYSAGQNFYNAVYPDRKKLKLWVKGENSDKLHDYSLMNNNAHLWSGYQVAEHYQRDDPNNMAGHETVAYSNGTHYVHVADDPKLRISDLVVKEPTATGFTIITRFHPLVYGISNQDSKIIEQKIDSSQNRYGHSINIDNLGNIYFYVKHNYRQYFCKLDAIPNLRLLSSNYASANYKPSNYKTELEVIPELYEEMYDLVCKFNYSTKEAYIRVYKDGALIAFASSLSGNNALPANLQLHLPLQEGKWSEVQALPSNTPLNQVYDASGNAVIGTINLPANGVWNTDNTFQNNNDAGAHFTFPSMSAFNTMSEFTFAFWYNPLDQTVPTITKYMVNKGINVANSFVIWRGANLNELKFVVYNTSASDFSQATISNAFPVANTWYFIVAKWKSGEKPKLSINNAPFVEGAVTETFTFNNTTNNLQIFRNTGCPKGIILNFMGFNRQITATEQTLLYNYGAHLAQFPTNLEPQRLRDPAPPPVTNPVVTIYDLPKLTSPVATDYQYLNNPSTQSPFVEKYNCPDGVPGSTAVTTLYNIAPGTGSTTTNPFTTVYNLPKPSSPSTGQIQASNEWAYTQRILEPNSVLLGKKITEISCWLDLNTASGGTIYLGIVKSDLTYITFGAAINPTDIDNGWTQVTRQLLTNSYVMADGDSVAVIWIGSGRSGALNIHRGGTGNHYDVDSSGNPRSYQNIAETSAWRTPNSDFSMAGVFKTGGDTTGTNPYYLLQNTADNFIFMGELFPTGSPMIGEKPTRAEFRVYRDTAANNGTVSIRHVKANNTYYPTLYQINVADLPNETAIPTTFNFVWENFDYANPILAGERIVVAVEGLTTGNVYVLSNVGNSGSGNNYDTTRSYLTVKRNGGTFSGNTGLDVSGVIKKGGSNFTAYQRFSETVTRIYERAVNSNSSFYDQAISRATPRGRRVGTIPSPSTITAVVRNSANEQRYVIGTLDANSIGTTLQDLVFTNNNNTIKIAANDYVSFEIGTCDANNYIELNINNNVVDTTNSLFGKLENGIIGDLAAFDLAGKFYTGGQIDNVSRKRVSQYIDTQDSILLTATNNRITSLTTVLHNNGGATGTIFFNIRRGSDDALIFSIGSYSASSVTTALAGSVVTITNYNNTYILSAKDKISIEYEAGSPTQQIGVQLRTNTNYDGVNSYIARHNGAEYDYITSKDLVATMKVGGDTFTPEANAPPPVLPQNPTDLYILASPTKKPTSFLRCIFGMYLFFNTIVSDQELLNFNISRIDTGNTSPDSIQVTNHSFFRNS